MNLLRVDLGPFTVEVPEDWDVVDYSDPRVLVIREPIAPDDPVAAIPGFVIPNIALRYFECPSDEGGVVRASLREVEASLTQVPGSVLLAVSPFVTDSGLPGRGSVIAGHQARVPFLSSRWSVGDGHWILEVTVTGPATPSPELMELGQHVAVSVRSNALNPVGGATRDLQGLIPNGLDDPVMMQAVTGGRPERRCSAGVAQIAVCGSERAY